METKRTYETPKLTAWGKVVDLTQVGNSSVSTDGCFGSITHSNENCQAPNRS